VEEMTCSPRANRYASSGPRVLPKAAASKELAVWRCVPQDLCRVILSGIRRIGRGLFERRQFIWIQSPDVCPDRRRALLRVGGVDARRIGCLAKPWCARRAAQSRGTTRNELAEKKSTGGPPQHLQVLSQLGRAFTRLVFEGYHDRRLTLRDVANHFNMQVKLV